MKRSDATPSLFDEAEPDEAQPVTDGSEDGLDDWDEVPQARFLSWSPAMQLHYCWRRDLDSALRAASATEATFFLERAATYKHDFDELR